METATFTRKEISKEPVIFTLLKKNPSGPKEYPVCVIVPTVDEVYEEVEEDGEMIGKQRVIRYIPGEKTIYADEQSKEAKYRPEPITILDGVLPVDYREVKLLDFLRKSNYNAAKKNRTPGKLAIYIEKDRVTEADVFLKDEKENLDMKNLIYSLDPYELEAYALVLGDKNADGKQTSEIRRDLLVFANTYPDKFKEGMTNAGMKRKVHVLKAVKAGVIICNDKDHEITWPDGKLIKQVPIGKDAVDYMVDLTFQPAYKEVYTYITESLYPTVAPSTMKKDSGSTKMQKHTPRPVQKDKREVELMTISSADLFRSAVNNKVLVKDKKSPWYRLFGKTEDKFGFGVKGCVKILNNDPSKREELYDIIKKETTK